MNDPDPNIRSFIVRIRLENQNNRKQKWYGWVIQIPDKKRLYFHGLLECFDIIAAKLDLTGAHVGWLWRVRRFLRLDRAVRNQSIKGMQDTALEEEPESQQEP